MKSENRESPLENKVDIKEKSSLAAPYKIIIIAGALIMAVLTGLYIYYIKTYEELEYIEIPETDEELGITEETEEVINIFENNKSIINILLFGVDKRSDEETGRSDAIMILTIDPVHNTIKLSSLMRDSRVSIKGYGEDKLGHAYAYGGPELAIHTINNNFRMNIRYFASINYGGLIHVIDSVGGIYANIKEDEIEMVNKYTNDTAYVEGMSYTPITESGYQLLDGVQAVGYSRIRKVGDGDYERTQRQRIVLSAVIRKLTDLNIVELPGVIQDLAPNIQTNITSNYMLKVGTSILNAGIKDIRQARFPSDENSHGEIMNGIWYLVFDKLKTREELNEYIFN
ncbi:LCP family protein [Proteiniclasticum sp. SCR006]|uniref:LCP family protein n=1 Tax=Proteiniclasticum aestuarii TaxID=2817862 RepID=A0A939KI69_9CLOT|nr:LCP family protein [Proteiniclasticum aestuarii]MBO1266324.1 LCP family protein [Proteiniclasticum aestuarii]